MAVYTEVPDDELARFIATYDIGELWSYKGIAEGVENSNYLVHTATGPFILTLYEKRVDPDDLPFFLGLMDHLAAAGFQCPTPVHDKNGQMLRELSGRPAAIVTFLEGLWIRRPWPEHCAALGRALAEFHLAGLTYSGSRPNSLSVTDWRPLLASSGARAETILAGLTGEMETELAFLEANWPDGLPNGIIHADLFPDNVFFMGKEISGFIDFYFACTDALAYDIAICLNAWCFEQDNAFNVTKARAMLKAYTQVRPLTNSEYDALPILARGAALRFLLTRVYDWLNTAEEALVKPKDPLEYVRKLRFHAQVTATSEYGLDKTE